MNVNNRLRQICLTLNQSGIRRFSTTSFTAKANPYYKERQKLKKKELIDRDIDLHIPDNAPSLQENDEWIRQLSRNAKSIAKDADLVLGIKKVKEEYVVEEENEEEVDEEEFDEEGEPIERPPPKMTVKVKVKETMELKQTYEIRDRSKLDSPETNPDYTSFTIDRKNYNFVSRPREDLYFNMSVPASDYFISSSPFSSNPAKNRPKVDSNQSFSDLRVVKLSSGKGGNGDVSFFRDAGVAYGPPDGGDGGNGGNVYVTAVSELSSLHVLKSTYIAENGANGHNGQLDGKNGNDLYITVPVGTSIRWCPDPKEIRMIPESKRDTKMFHIKTIGEMIKDSRPSYIQLFRNSYKPGEGWAFKDKDERYHLEREYFNELNEKITLWDKQTSYREIMGDIFPIQGIDFPEPTKEPVLLLAGGKGGMGNMHFLTPNIRNPRFAKVGRAGLSSYFIFELRLLADLGLVGLPNAGKSTLLRAISNARPRVGHWEFTTLQPTIGTIPISNRLDLPPFTVADIPGIVKGASENKGMGLNFLRHVERSGGLVFVISLGSENPIDDLTVLLEEMGEERVNGKNILVVATKADLEGSYEKFKKLREHISNIDREWKTVPCCAMKKENIEKVIHLMAECSGKLDQQ